MMTKGQLIRKLEVLRDDYYSLADAARARGENDTALSYEHPAGAYQVAALHAEQLDSLDES